MSLTGFMLNSGRQFLVRGQMTLLWAFEDSDILPQKNTQIIPFQMPCREYTFLLLSSQARLFSMLVSVRKFPQETAVVKIGHIDLLSNEQAWEQSNKSGHFKKIRLIQQEKKNNQISNWTAERYTVMELNNK